jgi:prolipoprotein diacylglyceryl transferase
MDALAPGIVLAQAIGRWGNYFNQELFGTPSKLPWALKIDPTKRPAGYVQYSTFHPTFLYESLYCLAIFGFLLWVSRRFRLYRGQMAALYIALYTFGRFWFENMRIDPAHHVGGLRINAWVSLGVFFVAVAWFVVAGRRGATAHDDKARTVTGDTDVNEPRPERVAAD